MLKFLSRRLLQLLPLLLGVLFLSFILQELWPNNAALNKVNQAQFQALSNLEKDELLQKEMYKLGLDLPMFYFSLTPMGESNPIPHLSWNGSQNRFHTYLIGNKERKLDGLLKGNLGKSFRTGRPVSTELWEKWKLSFFLSLFSLLLSFLLCILFSPILFFSRPALKKQLNNFLYALYATPSFIFGLALLYLFANKAMLYWFPAGGWGSEYEDNNFFSLLPYMVLPVATYVYGSFSFLTHIHQEKLKEEWTKPYITTAKAKGLSKGKVFIKHALKNSLFPLITAFGNYFPALIGGSIIIENLFSIPGMGFLTLQAVQDADFPVIRAIFLLTALFTFSGYLLSDVLYFLADPRLKQDES